MPALRFLGGLFLLIATLILVADITNSGGAVAAGLTVSLARHWANLAPSVLAGAQKSVQAVSPALWDPVLKTVLAVPAWALFAVLGATFAWLGRRRRRFNIYRN